MAYAPRWRWRTAAKGFEGFGLIRLFEYLSPFLWVDQTFRIEFGIRCSICAFVKSKSLYLGITTKLIFI